MRSNGNQCSLPGKVLVQFVLKSNKGFISSLVEMDIPKDGARNIRADFHRLNLKLSKCQWLHIWVFMPISHLLFYDNRFQFSI